MEFFEDSRGDGAFEDYAAERRKLIDPEHASLEQRPGAFAGPLPMPVSSESTVAARDSTCVNVVDRECNMFSATPSGGWLPSVVAGDTGLAMSERMQTFVLTPGHPNQLAPSKRPRVTLSPMLVLKDGKPFLAVSPGGDLQDQTLQVFLNIVKFNICRRRKRLKRRGSIARISIRRLIFTNFCQVSSTWKSAFRKLLSRSSRRWAIGSQWWAIGRIFPRLRRSALTWLMGC